MLCLKGLITFIDARNSYNTVNHYWIFELVVHADELTNTDLYNMDNTQLT